MAAHIQPANISSQETEETQGLATVQDNRESFSVSVGQDDWAHQVIDNVVGDSSDTHSDNDTQETANNEDSVANKILEKKRLFHESRFLELKNLPDGVTEQVKGWYF